MYEGERNAAGQYEGRGTYKSRTGNVYEGEWKAGNEEGRGTCRYASGTIYEGMWMAGQQEGPGTCTFADGDIYQGEWKACKREGRGSFQLVNGNVLVGFFKQDVPEGEGLIFSADRLQAARLLDGKKVEDISPEMAKGKALQLSLPIPPAKSESLLRFQKGANSKSDQEPFPSWRIWL